MTYDMYRYLYIIAACLSILLLLISVILCVKLNIPKIIRYLTGLNARKAIQHIRDENVKNGEKVYKPSHINLERGKITDKISTSGLINPVDHGVKVGPPTERLDSEEISFAGETTLLEHTYTQEQNCFAIEFDITYIHTDEIVI